MKLDGACARNLHASEADRRGRIELLHRRVLDGDSDAANELAIILLPVLRRVVHQSTRESDSHFVEDGIEHALLKYFRWPAAYEPDRSSLINWLAVMARNRVRDLQRNRRRRRLREVTYGIDPPAAPIAARADPPSRRPLHVLRRLAMSVAVSSLERNFLCAKLAGERRTRPLATILEVGGLPLPMQRRVVKRAWDCLRARMLRLEDIPSRGGRLESPHGRAGSSTEQAGEVSESRP